eukprot:12347511-Alexandrium_andersonii.AAC.1
MCIRDSTHTHTRTHRGGSEDLLKGLPVGLRLSPHPTTWRPRVLGLGQEARWRPVCVSVAGAARCRP